MRFTAWPKWLVPSVAALALVAGFAVSGLAAAKEGTDRGEGTTWLGVSMQELTSDLRDGMGYNGDGVLVSGVSNDSPADKAGVHKGDVITAVNGRKVDSPDALAREVRAGRAGQSVRLDVVRDGRTRTLSATLASRPDRVEMDMGDGDDDHDSGNGERHVVRRHGDFDFEMPDLGNLPMVMGRGRLGVRAESLSPDLADYFHASKGALVVEVLKDTPASRAGLRAGDVITKVGDKSVDSQEELVRALREEDRKTTLTVIRKGQSRTIEAELEAPGRAMGMMDMGDGDRHVIIRRSPRTPDAPEAPEAPELRRGNNDMERQLRDLRRQVEELQKKLDEMQRR
jgi:serine protease Do